MRAHTDRMNAHVYAWRKYNPSLDNSILTYMYDQYENCFLKTGFLLLSHALSSPTERKHSDVNANIYICFTHYPHKSFIFLIFQLNLLNG